MLQEALALWQAQPEGSVLKPHLRSEVILSCEFSYELPVRLQRRVLIERATGQTERSICRSMLSFNDFLRSGADTAGLAPGVRERVQAEALLQ